MVIVMELLDQLAEWDLEDEDPEVLRSVIDTGTDLVRRAEEALAAWGPS